MTFPEDSSICKVYFLIDYLARTAPLWHADAEWLFVSFIKPYKCVSSQTIARWIVQLLADACVNTDIFKQHSTCSTLAAWPWIGKITAVSVA